MYNRSVTLWSFPCLFPGADGTMILLSWSSVTIAFTFLNCWLSASELPPNFATTMPSIRLASFLFLYFQKNETPVQKRTSAYSRFHLNSKTLIPGRNVVQRNSLLYFRIVLRGGFLTWVS